MGDEENNIVTEIGKYVVNVSSSESTDGVDDVAGKSKKVLKKRNVSPAVQGITQGNNYTLELPEEVLQILNVPEKGTSKIKKELLFEVLERVKDASTKLLSVKNELIALNCDEVRIRREDIIADGMVSVTLVPMGNTPEKRDSINRSQILKAVVKEPRPWESLGSDAEILESLVTNTRPLIELQIDTRSLHRPVKLTHRTGDDAYSYVSLGPNTRTPAAVRRRTMDVAGQAVPCIKSTAAQVEPGLPVNAWTQYVYDMDEVQDAVQTAGLELPANYQFSQGDYMERELEYNGIFNLYTNDYPLLADGQEERTEPLNVTLEMMDAVTDVTLVAGKVAVCVAWHPMLPGVMAVLYAPHTRAVFHDDAMPKKIPDVFSSNIILLWTLKNTLRPFKVLDSPREATIIKWCPIDKNVLVGTCVSGQVAVWDLPPDWYLDKKPPDLSESQMRAKQAIYGILKWPVDVETKLTIMHPTAMSNLACSHQCIATDLQWLSPYHRVNSLGHYKLVKKFSMQFMTCGVDGSILIWDLNEIVPEAQKLENAWKREEEDSKKFQQPYSRFKFYHRLLKPIYKFIPQISSRKSRLVCTTLVADYFSLNYELDKECSSDSKGRIYKPSISGDAKNSPERTIWLGTEDGVVLVARWQGISLDDSEEAKIENTEVVGFCAAIHDGPIVSIVRSTLLPELLMSVGGHIWVIWSAERPTVPVLYRRSPVWLTCGIWSSLRPNLMYITRHDGTLELWNWLIRSDRPLTEQSMSGGPLTAIAMAPYTLLNGQHVMAIGDNRNSLNFYYAPQYKSHSDPQALTTMRDSMRRELDVHSRYEAWNAQFLSNYLQAHPKPAIEVADKKPTKRVVNLISTMEAAEDKKFAKGRKKNIAQSSSADEKMLAVLLKKKNLNKEDLMAKREPLRQRQQIEADRRERHRQKIKHQQEEYEKIVTALLPDPNEVKLETETTDDIKKEVQELVKQSMEDWRKNGEAWSAIQPQQESFDLKKVLADGVARRNAIEKTLFGNTAREDRFELRKEHWLKNPPSPPPPIVPSYPPANKASLTSLALCQPTDRRHLSKED